MYHRNKCHRNKIGFSMLTAFFLAFLILGWFYMNFNTLTVIQTIFCAEFHSNFIWILKKREKNYLYLDRWLNLSNILQWTDKLFSPFNIHFCRMGLCTLRNYKYGYVSINWMLFFFMIECLLLKKNYFKSIFSSMKYRIFQ